MFFSFCGELPSGVASAGDHSCFGDGHDDPIAPASRELIAGEWRSINILKALYFSLAHGYELLLSW